MPFSDDETLLLLDLDFEVEEVRFRRLRGAASKAILALAALGATVTLLHAHLPPLRLP